MKIWIIQTICLNCERYTIASLAMEKYLLKVIAILILISAYSCSDYSEDEFPMSNECFHSNAVLPHGTYSIYEHPPIYEIMNDATVVNAMNQAWSKMKSLVVPFSHRQEVGFYIYHSNFTGYWIGDFVYGPKASYLNGEPGSVNLGKCVNNLQVCAHFHCHTPWYGFSQRPTGPSEDDEIFATQNNLPGIVYDYSTTPLDATLHEFYDEIPPYPFIYGPLQRPSTLY